jgi:two-component system sensor histidine kinase YesM
VGNNRPAWSIRNSILYPSIGIVVVSLLIVTIVSYLNYRDTTSEIVRDSSREINKQIILNFENYIASVIDTADYIQQKTIEFGLRDQNDELDDVYRQATEVQTDIESIVLLDLDGEVVQQSTSSVLSTIDWSQTTWFLDAFTNRDIYHFSSPHIQELVPGSTVEVITVTKWVDYYVGGIKYNGILVVDINTSNIITLTETTNLGEDGHIVILNDDDSLIYTNQSSCIGGDCRSIELARDLFGGQSVTIGDKLMYANVNTLYATRWRMATFINTEILRQSSNRNLVLMGILTASTIVVTIAVSSIISRAISSPINRLKDHMQRIEQGEYYQEIDINGQKEVVMLTHSFNSMIVEMRSLMDRIVDEQRAKRRTEFQALQNQINPHFLYNTLDSIVYLSEQKMNDKVIQMVVALSRFFRISISRGNNVILLKEELEHARNYLLIQQIRYHEKFDYRFEVDPAVESDTVVKLSLQPLIENAINHGINTEYKRGLIVIRAYAKDDRLVLEVEDDGYGIEDAQIAELMDRIKGEHTGQSIGMRNVYQRLCLYYGEPIGFDIVSELDESTIVRITLPRKG